MSHHNCLTLWSTSWLQNTHNPGCRCLPHENVQTVCQHFGRQYLIRGSMTKLVSDSAQVEMSNKVKDLLRMYISSSWHSEAYHQNQNDAKGRYRTIKNWTNTIMNRTGALADCWSLCMTYVCYLFNYMSCNALKDSVSLTKLYGVTPDISILLLYTFYQPVFYATHNQSFPSTSEVNAAFGLVLANMLVMPLPTSSWI